MRYEEVLYKVLPFFDEYPVKGVKALDYSDFKKVANLMSKKVHLTEQGISEIECIKSNMDSARSLD